MLLLYHMAERINENTAGEAVFNPIDQDFLGESYPEILKDKNSATRVGGDEFEKPASIFGLRILFIWIITVITATKKGFLGKNLKTNSFWFDGISQICRDVKDNAYSWRALEIIYNLPNYLSKKMSLDRIALYWNGLENAKAVRNRLRLTKEILSREIVKRKSQDTIRLLSIASGSARAVLETLAEVVDKHQVSFEFRLLDLDPTASVYAQNLATELGVANRCKMIVGSTTDMKKLLGNYRPDIIEMVGFLEYRNREKAVNLLKKIKELLAPGGSIIFSQVKPNREMYFLRFVMNWPMIYRTEEEFRKILVESGYYDYELVSEPIGIHMVCSFRKEG